MPIKNKILDIKNLKKIRSKFIGKKIVLCHGVFDLLHIGHINYFKSSKKYGNILVVSVTSDKFVNKGPGRPAFSINNRLKFLQEIDCVDYIYSSNDFTAEKVIKNQLEAIFANITLNASKDYIIAYEPLWAIGTGISADKKTIKSCHDFIKKTIQKITQNNRNIYILYGGSVDETNASNILSIENVDGFLVGSASIKSNSFYNIYNKF